MDTQNFGTGLRYVDAEELERSHAGLMVGAEIRDRENAKVGELDGCVVDAVTGRPKYAVIESGGVQIGAVPPSEDTSLALDGNCTSTSSVLRSSSSRSSTRPAGFGLVRRTWAFEYETLSACCPEDAASWRRRKSGELDRWALITSPPGGVPAPRQIPRSIWSKPRTGEVAGTEIVVARFANGAESFRPERLTASFFPKGGVQHHFPCKVARIDASRYLTRPQVPIWSTGSLGPFGHQGPVPRTPQPNASPAGGRPRLLRPRRFLPDG